MANWNDLLLAYLHDPPDKAISVRGHVSRARDNAHIAVGDHVSRSILEEAVSTADPLASIIERFPMPTAGAGQRAVGPQKGQLNIFHPLSAASTALSLPELTKELAEAEKGQLREIIADLPGEGEEQSRNRFLAIWRLWQDGLAANVDECLARLPADTRSPDNTIWHHLDITAAFKAAEAEGRGAALLMFTIGPVQRFIEAARSVRDLWSGSMILSWLSFRAMLPIVEELGPTALVYPALRGIPLIDLWLRDSQRLGDKVPRPDVDLRLTPALPHRFLALVPRGSDGETANNLASECRNAAAAAWMDLARNVKDRIQAQLDALFVGWDKRWDKQIADYFSTSTAVVPLEVRGEDIDRRLARLLANQEAFSAAFANAEAARELARSIPEGDRPGYAQDHAGRWQYQVDLVGRSLASHRSVRHVPVTASVSNSDERFPQKCTLLGSFEQMGPDDLRQSKDFWDKVAAQNGLTIDGVRLRRGEALSAVALVKRFAAPAFLRSRLQLSLDDLRFPDTWTVAAAKWLSDASIDWKNDWRDEAGRPVPWNGHWLQWSEPDQNLDDADMCPAELWAQIQDSKRPEQFGSPPVYYAILKLDGDDLGSWLRGEKSPTVREVMHPDLMTYYENLGERAQAGLDAKRPVGPALHAAISTALSNFALHIVPNVVKKHHGTVIYSGGDDTLILLPVATALECASELQRAYITDWYDADGHKLLMMGSRATLSGGLVVVHAKDDLRLALKDARAAEKKAKVAGKNALCLSIRRRSGEQTWALCPWPFSRTVAGWLHAFLPDDQRRHASDRWAYHLAGEVSTLTGLERQAIAAEIRRQVNRAESDTRRRLGEPEQPKDGERAGDIVSDQFNNYYDLIVNSRRQIELADALKEFLTLCQSASFMARGRET